MSRGAVLSILWATLLAAMALEAWPEVTCASTGPSLPAAEAIRAMILRRECARAESAAVALESAALTAPVDSSHLALAWDLGVEASRCFGTPRNAESLTRAQRVYALRTRLQSAPLDLAWTQSNLGAALIDAGQAKAGFEAIEEGHARALRAPGISDTLLGRFWNRKGVGLEAVSQMAAAESAYAQALVHRRRAFGTQHLETMQALNNLAGTIRKRGRPGEAVGLLKELLSAREALLGPRKREVAAALLALSAAEWDHGQARAARQHAERALSIFEELGPEQRYSQAGCRQQLGFIANASGDYRTAEEQFSAAAELLRQIEGEASPNRGNLLVNIGSACRARGDYLRAEEYLRAGLDLMEKGLGESHTRLYPPLAELGHCLKETARCSEAVEVYQRGIRIRESTYGPMNSELIGGLAGIADCQEKLGDRQGAYANRLRALQIAEAAEGPDSHRAATARLIVAMSLRDLGRYEEADREARRGLQALEKGIAPRGPEVATGLLILSRTLTLAGRRSDEALDLALRAEELGREHLRHTARYLSEREALAYSASRQRGIPAALSLLFARPVLAPRADEVADACVRGRALVEDELLRRLRVQIRVGAAEFDSLREAIAELRGREPVAAERLERDLAARVEALGGPRDETPSGLAELRRALPADALLAGFVRFEREPVGNQPTGPWYAVYTLSAAAPQPVFTPLAPADSVENAIRAWRAEVDRAPSAKSAELDALQAGLALRRLIWDRWQRPEGAEVFLVPDGDLLRVNFGALPQDPGADGSIRYLIESAPLLHYLSAERDLFSVGPRTGQEDGPLLALGAPDFDGQAASPAALTGGGGPISAIALARGVEEDCSALRDLRFRPLPAAREELREVESACRSHQIPIERHDGVRASEAVLVARAVSSSALHLATHAFYYDCESAAGASNPVLRSGIALAGANRRRSGTAPEEDGLLSAAEIGTLDLSRTRSAVLSACGTGLGQIVAGEGVLGLRRAFKVAGVQSLVVSLWPVDDRTTRDWMRFYYREPLAPPALRVQAAQRSALSERRVQGESTHPFYWGAFIATGE
ncbi:MAG: CHAT domain-containing protein [Candidatus Eisenbacteria bacterium]|nr:CHAT domain-containing protein [Candidatus Eisenbacteria bacterium]